MVEIFRKEKTREIISIADQMQSGIMKSPALDTHQDETEGCNAEEITMTHRLK